MTLTFPGRKNRCNQNDTACLKCLLRITVSSDLKRNIDIQSLAEMLEILFVHCAYPESITSTMLCYSGIK